MAGDQRSTSSAKATSSPARRRARTSASGSTATRSRTSLGCAMRTSRPQLYLVASDERAEQRPAPARRTHEVALSGGDAGLERRAVAGDAGRARPSPEQGERGGGEEQHREQA